MIFLWSGWHDGDMQREIADFVEEGVDPGVLDRVREAIAASPFLTGLVADPDGVVVTASFGIASFPLHARTKEDMVVQADRAMQRIKNGTKNSIAIAEIVGDSHEP